MGVKEPAQLGSEVKTDRRKKEEAREMDSRIRERMRSHCANIGPAIGTTCLITDKTPAPSTLWPLLSSRHAFYMNRRH